MPANGIVEVHPGHHEVKADLRGRGFRQMRPLDRFGKATDGGDLAQMFRPSRLAVIGRESGMLGGLIERAGSAVPSEVRREDLAGPGPAPTYCSSAVEFHRRFFGRN